MEKGPVLPVLHHPFFHQDPQHVSHRVPTDRCLVGSALEDVELSCLRVGEDRVLDVGVAPVGVSVAETEFTEQVTIPPSTPTRRTSPTP